MTPVTLSEFRRRGPGYFVTRCVLRLERFELRRAGRAVAVLLAREELERLERAAAELEGGRGK